MTDNRIKSEMQVIIIALFGSVFPRYVRQRETEERKIIVELCNMPRRVGTKTDKTALVPLSGGQNIPTVLYSSGSQACQAFGP